MPATMRSVVDLPQPDGTRKATNSPLWISRSNAWTAGTWPKCLVSLSSRTRTPLALHATAVDLEQLLLSKQEQHHNGQHVIQPDRRQDAVVDEAALAQHAADRLTQRRLRAAWHEHERQQEFVPARDEGDQAQSKQAGLD